MKDNNHYLKKNGFSFAGSITHVKKEVQVSDWTDDAIENFPGIYCWVLFDQMNNIKEVLYIGKYGKNLKKRFREHIGGFRGASNSGLKKKSFLVKKLKDTKTKIEIWHKKSYTFKKEYTSVLDHKKSGRFSTEGYDEKDMIEYVTKFQKFAPKLNGTKGG